MLTMPTTCGFGAGRCLAGFFAAGRWLLEWLFVRVTFERQQGACRGRSLGTATSSVFRFALGAARG
jgi:hypothetical protein